MLAEADNLFPSMKFLTGGSKACRSWSSSGLGPMLSNPKPKLVKTGPNLVEPGACFHSRPSLAEVGSTFVFWPIPEHNGRSQRGPRPSPPSSSQSAAPSMVALRGATDESGQSDDVIEVLAESGVIERASRARARLSASAARQRLFVRRQCAPV